VVYDAGGGGLTPDFSDYRKAAVFQTYRAANAAANTMNSMVDGFDYIVELQEVNDCSDMWIIHA
jgi:hypothetical protein